MKRSVLLLGATGSIGTQTVDVLNLHADRFSVLGLSCGRDVETLYAQANALRPRFVASVLPLDETRLPEGTVAFSGPDAAMRRSLPVCCPRLSRFLFSCLFSRK